MRTQTSSYQSPERFRPLGFSRQSAMPGKQQAKSALLYFAPFEGWFVLLLLGIALYCVVASIMGAEWVSNSSWLVLSPAVGLLIGLLVAKMPHLPQFILHLGACLVGHWLSVWLTCSLFQVPWTVVLGDLRAVFAGQFVNMGMPASDVIFFFYLSFLSFFLGYFGSWLVYRAHLPWLVVLVYTSIMLVNLNFGKQDMSYLAVIMAAALLLLIARMQLVIQVAQWKREGLHTDRQWLHSMKRRYMQVACIIVVLTLILSWLLPMQDQNADGKAFWDHLNTVGADVMNGHLSWQDLNAFVTGSDQANFFGDQLTISNTVHLPTSEVLRYQTVDKAPHYLEGFTFNTFDGHIWTSPLDDTNAHAYRANDRLAPDPPSQDEQRITISITLPPNGTKNYIFAPANPRIFNVPTIVYGDRRAGAEAWTQQQPLSAHETYEATFIPPSIAPVAPPPLSDNTDWRLYGLPGQYFQVPANIDPQVKQQALSWTNGAADAYTALKMLEKHLSDTAVFTYSLDNRPVPANTDVISWLLKTRTGYCTYYATAMAIMARMLNIPVRIVNGFSQGRYDTGSGQWVVKGDDAHSWVQAFFPDTGWINFDPTPGFAPNALPPQQPHTAPTPLPSPTGVVPAPTPTVAAQATSPALSGKHPDNPPPLSTPPGGNGVVWIVVSCIGLFFAIVFLFIALVRYWWLNLYTSSPLISGMYWRFCRVASFFGMAPGTSQTPYEYGHMIGQCLPHQAHTFLRLTDLFVREHWGGPQQAVQSLKEAEVKDLSPSLRSLLIDFFVHKFSRNSSP